MDTRPPSGSADTPTEGRLDSWKEIAAYLERDVRTAKRWEAEGLPVHRHHHNKQATVYAYQDEVAAWVSTRQPSSTTTQQAVASSRPWRRWAMGAAGSALAVALAVAFWPTASPPVEFAERDWVLVTDFDDRTGEVVLSGTLKGALTRELSDSRFVNVVPPERVGDVLRLMRRPPDAPVDRALGLEIGLRDGNIRAVLTGQVEKLDSTYLLSATIVDPTTGVAMGVVRQTAQGEHALVTAIQRLSNDVRATLGETIASITQTAPPLERVTTPSLRALQLYSQADAVIAGRGGPNGDAVAEALLEQAVAEDPGFASAYILLAHAIRNQRPRRPPEEYLPYAARAFKLADTTSDRERYFILGSYHSMFDRAEEAVAAYETLLRLHPDHYWATNNLVAGYRQLGRLEEALPYVMRRADLRQHDFSFNVFAAHQTLQAGADVALARPYAERARQLELAGEGGGKPEWQNHWLALFPVYDHWLANDPSSALEALTPVAESVRSVNQQRRDELALYVGSAYVMLGVFEAAEDVFRSIRDEEVQRQGLAEVAWLRGDLRAAREHARNASLWYRALIPFGETEWALEFLRNPPRFAPALRVPMEQFVRGRVALAQGDGAAASALVEAGNQALPPGLKGSFLSGAALLARAWSQQGELERAVDAIDDASRGRPQLLVGPALRAVIWLRNEAERARLNRELGRVRTAEQE